MINYDSLSQMLELLLQFKVALLQFNLSLLLPLKTSAQVRMPACKAATLEHLESRKHFLV